MRSVTEMQTVGAVYTKGFLFDEQGQMLFGVTVTLLDDSNNAVAAPVTLDADSNSFTVWTENPSTYRVRFQKEGYAEMVVAFDYLQTNPEVYMTAVTTEQQHKQYWWLALLAIPVLMKKKKQVGRVTQDDLRLVLMGIGGLLAFTVVKKLLERFGVLEGAGTQSVQQQQSDPLSPWKPTYWKQFTTFTVALSTTQAQQYAGTIHNAFGIFQDDYNAVWGVFSNMRTKSNVSFLADIFLQKYNEDLLTFLTNGGGVLPWDGLSEDHLKNITSYVNSLPTH